MDTTTVMAVPSRFEIVRYLVAAVLCNVADVKYRCNTTRICRAFGGAWEDQTNAGHPIPPGLALEFFHLHDSPFFCDELNRALIALHGSGHIRLLDEKGDNCLQVMPMLKVVFDDGLGRCDIIRDNMFWIAEAAQTVEAYLLAASARGP